MDHQQKRNAAEVRASAPKWGPGPYESLLEGPKAAEALNLGTPARGVLFAIALAAAAVMCWFVTSGL